MKTPTILERFLSSLTLACAVVSLSWLTAASANDLRVAVFKADITPPLGSPLCYGYVKPAAKVECPLEARGIVILGKDKPIVLCCLDFVGIANESYDLWRKRLAEAATTTSDRVALHVIHNHDAPGYDVATMQLLDEAGLTDFMALSSAHDRALQNTVLSLRNALKEPVALTHLGTGVARVKNFASNRRIIGENGKLKVGRMSSSRIPEAKAAPEGTIDPELNLFSFWNNDKAIAVLSFYACHPQSYYGRGGVTPDTVGLARNGRENDTGIFHLHFAGAGGNVAAGKYNDGSEKARNDLTSRLQKAIKEAWENQTKQAVAAEGMNWKTVPVAIPWRGLRSEDELVAELGNRVNTPRNRVRAARDLVFLRRCKSGRKILLQKVRLTPDASLLFFPGELFVEYQIAAKAMVPDMKVGFAAYGDSGPGYIGTEIAYQQGGYEVSRVSRTAPEVEKILTEATRQLLGK